MAEHQNIKSIMLLLPFGWKHAEIFLFLIYVAVVVCIENETIFTAARLNASENCLSHVRPLSLLKHAGTGMRRRCKKAKCWGGTIATFCPKIKLNKSLHGSLLAASTLTTPSPMLYISEGGRELFSRSLASTTKQKTAQEKYFHDFPHRWCSLCCCYSLYNNREHKKSGKKKAEKIAKKKKSRELSSELGMIRRAGIGFDFNAACLLLWTKEDKRISHKRAAHYRSSPRSLGTSSRENGWK